MVFSYHAEEVDSVPSEKVEMAGVLVEAEDVEDEVVAVELDGDLDIVGQEKAEEVDNWVGAAAVARKTVVSEVLALAGLDQGRCWQDR